MSQQIFAVLTLFLRNVLSSRQGSYYPLSFGAGTIVCLKVLRIYMHKCFTDYDAKKVWKIYFELKRSFNEILWNFDKCLYQFNRVFLKLLREKFLNITFNFWISRYDGKQAAHYPLTSHSMYKTLFRKTVNKFSDIVKGFFYCIIKKKIFVNLSHGMYTANNTKVYIYKKS